MKKFLLVASVAVATMLTSCKKDDDNDSIEGAWQLESFVVNGIAETLDDCDKKSTMSFTSTTASRIEYYTAGNNECKVESEGTGTYVISGDKLTITESDGEVILFTFSVSGDRLVLTQVDDATSISTFKRI